MSHIDFSVVNNRLHIVIDRAEKANAMDSKIAKQLMALIKKYSSKVRCIALEGRGKNLSSGADLAWIYKEANLLPLAEMYWTFLTCAVPIVSAAKGKNTGGALGLLAAADVAVGTPESSYQLTETRLGLSPGIITPLLQWRMGSRRLAELALLHPVISADRALEIGLLSAVEANTQAYIEHCQHQFEKATARSLSVTKAMLLKNSGITKQVLVKCARQSSQLAKDNETRQRIALFLRNSQ